MQFAFRTNSHTVTIPGPVGQWHQQGVQPPHGSFQRARYGLQVVHDFLIRKPPPTDPNALIPDPIRALPMEAFDLFTSYSVA